MKLKHAIIILVIGFCFDFVGGTFKILHYLNADKLLLVGVIFKVIGTVLILYKFLTHPKIKDFLNR